MKNELFLKNIMIYSCAVALILFAISIGLAVAPVKPVEEPLAQSEFITPIPILTVSHEKDAGILEPQVNDIFDPHKALQSGYVINYNATLPESLFELGFNEEMDRGIYIKKPAEASLEISIEQDFNSHCFYVTLKGISENELNSGIIYRIDHDKFAVGDVFATPTPTPSPTPLVTATPSPFVIPTATPTPYVFDLVNAIYVDYNSESQTAVLTLDARGYWNYSTSEDENGYLISLFSPKTNKKIIVLDAGHGGRDVGAIARDRVTYESNITLDVILRIKEKLDKHPELQVYYTRTDNSYPTLDARVDLANGVNADLFLSVHCNSAVNQYLNGSEVLFNKNQGVDDAFNSRSLASICLEKVSNSLGTKMGGLVRADDIKIVRLAQMPVALIELCYISNENDFNIIKTEEARAAVAEAIYESILEALEHIN